MANMIPPMLADDHGSAAEGRIFAALAGEVSDDFWCYHSKELLVVGPRGANEGEIDFVILHRSLGLLALEVKGGGLIRDSRGCWYRRRRDGREEPLKKDPFAQVRKSLHKLVDLVERRVGAVLPHWEGRLRLPFGYAVAAPDVRIEDIAGNGMPSNAAPEVVLDAASLGRLEQDLVAAMRIWSRDRPPIDARDFKRFRKHVIHPVLNLVPSLSALIQRDEAAFVRLTDSQTRILDITADLHRVSVRGGAGTGKTVIAVERARRYAAEGKRCCVLCYNRPLAEAAQRALVSEDTEDLLQVYTYHGLCRLAAHRLGAAFDVPSDPEAATVFWRETAPAHLLDAVSSGDIAFDALIVDEAQDFEGEWWATLELLAGDSPLWVFYDPEQDIYERAGALPKGLTPLVLKENCRSTRRLRELCDQLSGRETSSPPFVPEGEPHIEIQYRNPTDLRKRLAETVEALTSKERLSPRHLAILSPHTQRNSSLAGISSLAGVPVVSVVGDEGIVFSTARRFKGLEADVVILIDQDINDPACTGVHRYVAASRARHRLIVFCKQEWATA